MNPLSQCNVETIMEEIVLDVQGPVEAFMNIAESLDVSSIDDLITFSEHTIETVQEKTDIEESVGLYNKADNNDYLITGPLKTFPSLFKRALF